MKKVLDFTQTQEEVAIFSVQAIDTKVHLIKLSSSPGHFFQDLYHFQGWQLIFQVFINVICVKVISLKNTK